jgi:hypothetical protein
MRHPLLDFGIWIKIEQDDLWKLHELGLASDDKMHKHHFVDIKTEVGVDAKEKLDAEALPPAYAARNIIENISVPEGVDASVLFKSLNNVHDEIGKVIKALKSVDSIELFQDSLLKQVLNIKSDINLLLKRS